MIIRIKNNYHTILINYNNIMKLIISTTSQIGHTVCIVLHGKINLINSSIKII